MCLAVEVLDPVVVKHAIRQPRIRVDLLRILLHMGLLLNPLELPKQKHRSVFDMILPAFLLRDCCFLLHNMSKDGVIDGQAIDGIELLH